MAVNQFVIEAEFKDKKNQATIKQLREFARSPLEAYQLAVTNIICQVDQLKPLEFVRVLSVKLPPEEIEAATQELSKQIGDSLSQLFARQLTDAELQIIREERCTSGCWRDHPGARPFRGMPHKLECGHHNQFQRSIGSNNG